AELILEARHGCLDETSSRVAGFSLPTASTDTIDMSDVRISLVARYACIVAGFRIAPGRDEDSGRSRSV
ncbi:MAG: hypothetical protein WD078_09795, partial [Woeseia sp.]